MAMPYAHVPHGRVRRAVGVVKEGAARDKGPVNIHAACRTESGTCDVEVELQDLGAVRFGRCFLFLFSSR
jgi:hypothetical protein